MKTTSLKRSKYYLTMVDILDNCFPKHKCKERGEAMVMLAYIEMMLLGVSFDKNGLPRQGKKDKLYEKN